MLERLVVAVYARTPERPRRAVVRAVTPGYRVGVLAVVTRPDGRLLLVEHGPSSSRAVRALQHLLDPLAVRWQADHLLRDPRRLALGAGFAVVEADRAGRADLVHRVHATTSA